MRLLRVLLVDDERLARRGLRRELEKMDDVQIVGEECDGAGAVRAIRRLRPDLVLLDIQMPGMDGFQVVRELGPGEMPAVVFVTAHDEHAIRAFEVNAVDYVLKPVEPRRFATAVRRATERQGAAGWVTVEKAGRVSLVATDRIRWVASAGNYARIHTEKDTYLIRRTMESLDRELAPRGFLRVRRSAIVNLAHVMHFQPQSDGRYRIRLEDGTELRASRRYRARIKVRLAHGR